MSSEKEKAQSEVYRLEQDLRSARAQVDLHKSRIAKEADESKKVILRGTLAGAESALRNAERALGDAQTRLRSAK